MKPDAQGGGAPASFLFVTQYFPPELGAVQVRLAAVTARLVEAGHRVEVVTTLPNYPTGRIFPGWSRRPIQVGAERGTRVVRVWSWPAIGGGLGRILNYATFGLASIVGLLLARPADWVVVEYPTLFGALPAVLWCRLRRRKVVVNVADLWLDVIVNMGGFRDGVLVRILRRLERWMLAQATVVTYVTEGLRDVLLERGVRPEVMAWLPNGVDTEMFHPGPGDPRVRDELGLGDADHLVLYAGTQGFVHRLEVVLEAAAILRDEPVRFVLVGGGSEKESLRELARTAELANVTFMDPVPPERIAEMLRVASIGLASVRGGELYRAIRSAKMWPVMSTAKPVLYSGDDEGSRLVTSIPAGVATPPEDAEALAAAVRSLLENPTEADRLGKAGRQWVEENASWQRLVGDWMDRLEEIAPPRPAASSA